MNRVRGCSVNEEQKKILIEFLKKHPDLLKGTFSSQFTCAMAKKRWGEIAGVLNTVPGGAEKDWKQWRKTWQDMKRSTRAKTAAQRRYAGGTGGGGPFKDSNSSFDNEILETIPTVSIEGLAEVEESYINFDFEEVPKCASPNQYQQAQVISFELDKTFESEEDTAHNPQILSTSPTRLAKDKEQNMETPRILSPVTDHSYVTNRPTVAPGRKRLTKTRQLENSQKLTLDMVKNIENRSAIIEDYYLKKKEYFDHLQEYHKKKIEVMEKKNDIAREMVSEMKSIKNLLMQRQ